MWSMLQRVPSEYFESQLQAPWCRTQVFGLLLFMLQEIREKIWRLRSYEVEEQKTARGQWLRLCIGMTLIVKCGNYDFIFVQHDNYSKKIVMMNSYFQTSPEEPRPVQHFMKWLQEVVVPFLTNNIRPRVEMIISEEEEKMFKASTRCYCCLKRFRDMSGDDNKVRDHCHVLGLCNVLFTELIIYSTIHFRNL